MKKTMSIEVEKEEFKKLSSILEREEAVEEEKSTYTFKTFIANFGDGIEAEIKVCNGNPPFVDAVLFENNQEVAVLEISEELEGEYFFDYKGEIYTVILKVA